MKIAQEQAREIAESIDEEFYFEEARRWYTTVYMSIIPERILFIVLTTIAVTTGILALVAVLRLMPLNPRDPFLYLANDVLREVPIIRPVRMNKEETTNEALRKFFVEQYIVRREGYSSDTVDERINFVRNHSSDKVALRYATLMSVDNARSPVREYGKRLRVVPDVRRADIVIEETPRPNIYKARVNYREKVYGEKLVDAKKRVATMVFSYKDLLVEQSESMEDEDGLQVTPMEFRVLKYDAR